MKRFISMLLSVAILTLVFIPSVSAAALSSDLDALKEIWLSEDQYYYNQLSDEHKTAWELDISNALNYPRQFSALAQDRRYQALASMIKTDNPRIFWIDWIDSYGRLRFETGSTATLAMLKLPDGRPLSEFQQTFLDAIPVAVAEIQSRLPADAGTRDKAQAIHDWLCENNTYNYDQTSSHKAESDPVAFAFLAAHSAYSAIVTGDEYEPVCEGYAGAFKLLCDEFGVTCISVHGSTTFASGHMWNYVQLDDGLWYLVDVTSDDVEASGTPYYHYYFLVGREKVASQGFNPQEYMNSGINPSNNYTEGAAFTVPDLVN